MAKKKINTDYNPSNEERLWYKYCMDNDIRISPKGTSSGNRWHIDVSLDGIKWHTSPDTYDIEELWVKYYQVCKYYYNKKT